MSKFLWGALSALAVYAFVVGILVTLEDAVLVIDRTILALAGPS